VSNSTATSEEELRRLFYVALTRAEQFLTISYAKQKDDGKDLEASMFLEEIKAGHALPEDNPIPSENTITEFNLVRLLSGHSPIIEKMDTDIIDKALG